jgi:hypothetical protein
MQTISAVQCCVHVRPCALQCMWAHVRVHGGLCVPACVLRSVQRSMHPCNASQLSAWIPERRSAWIPEEACVCGLGQWQQCSNAVPVWLCSGGCCDAVCWWGLCCEHRSFQLTFVLPRPCLPKAAASCRTACMQQGPTTAVDWCCPLHCVLGGDRLCGGGSHVLLHALSASAGLVCALLHHILVAQKPVVALCVLMHVPHISATKVLDWPAVFWVVCVCWMAMVMLPHAGPR